MIIVSLPTTDTPKASDKHYRVRELLKENQADLANRDNVGLQLLS